MSTLSEATELRARIAGLEEDLRAVRGRLERIERSCQHRWGEMVYSPVHHPGQASRKALNYDDAPYAAGYPAYDTPRWIRTCEICGYVQSTTSTKDEVKKVPAFPGGR